MSSASVLTTEGPQPGKNFKETAAVKESLSKDMEVKDMPNAFKAIFNFKCFRFLLFSIAHFENWIWIESCWMGNCGCNILWI